MFKFWVGYFCLEWGKKRSRCSASPRLFNEIISKKRQSKMNSYFFVISYQIMT